MLFRTATIETELVHGRCNRHQCRPIITAGKISREQRPRCQPHSTIHRCPGKWIDSLGIRLVIDNLVDFGWAEARHRVEVQRDGADTTAAFIYYKGHYLGDGPPYKMAPFHPLSPSTRPADRHQAICIAYRRCQHHAPGPS